MQHLKPIMEFRNKFPWSDFHLKKNTEKDQF